MMAQQLKVSAVKTEDQGPKSGTHVVQELKPNSFMLSPDL